ncbi:MAG: hypothetical protein AAB666_01165, partial [Patescibacteria group bacterium]
MNSLLRKILLVVALLLVSCSVTYAEQTDTVAPEASAFPDGSVIRLRGSPHRYFVRGGKKWPISGLFTFQELGVKHSAVKTVDAETLSSLKDGEKIKISPPRIDEMFDMHEHFRVGGNMKAYLQVAKKLGIAKTVFVPTGSGPDNAGYKENMAALLKEQKKHPSSVIAFCTVDEADPKAPEVFSNCINEGGQGLKLIGGH